MENFNASEGERIGKRAGEKIGLAAEVAGQKLDAMVDRRKCKAKRQTNPRPGSPRRVEGDERKDT